MVPLLLQSLLRYSSSEVRDKDFVIHNGFYFLLQCLHFKGAQLKHVFVHQDNITIDIWDTLNWFLIGFCVEMCAM